jgi:hydroxyacylglutathione hydrolase
MNKTTIEILALPAFQDNYIWLLRVGGYAAVVDPGDAAPVLAHLADSGDRLCAILLTHHHADHIGGLAELLAHPQTSAGLPVFGPALNNIAGVNRPLSGGEIAVLPELNAALDVIAVPGHTLGHLAYYGASLIDSNLGALFCGDTLFGAGCGRLFEGTPTQMQHSLAKITALPASTFVFCAHEYTQSNLRFACVVEPDNPDVQCRSREVAAARSAGLATVPTRIGVELATNPFLRWDEPAVRIAAAAQLGQPPQNAVETFAAIRAWKDRF